MTVTQSPRKPSPFPRTETPTVVTERVTETCSADPQVPAVERETPAGKPSILQSAITVGSRIVEGVRRYWTFPPLLTVQPPTIDQLKAYARRAAYADKTGVRRACGVVWCYGVAIPATVSSRVWAALWERPGRIFAVWLTVKLLSFTPPVVWAVDHVLTPAARAALWLFL